MATALLATAAALGAVGTQAQDWPSRQPIRLVAVFPPGGSVDQVARLLAPHLQQELGQNVIVENKGGASGSIGAAQVAAAAPDGYTFAVVFDTHGVNPALIPNLPFDSKKDLTTVIVIGSSPMVLATHAGSGFRSFADVVAAARTDKAPSYGSIGSGSLGHLAMALLGRNNGLNFTHVPYKGGGPLMNDAVAGHVPLAIGSVFVVKPHIDSKRLRPLAVTTSQRAPQLPDVPTIAESGFAGFEAPAWWAVLAPAKTPAAVVQRMNEAINKVMRKPEVATRLQSQGIEVLGGTPQAGQAFVEGQMDIWGKVVKDNGIKPD
jgi:tripartite-type tricarboxylate transporter receptor subunit TctC